MNFEFKSTFNRIKKLLSFKLSHSWAILLFNISASAIILYLYFSNRFLPAVLGSYPHGHFYILLVKITMVLKVASSAYALAHIVVDKRYNKDLLSALVRVSILPLSHRIRTTALLLMQPLGYLLNSVKDISTTVTKNSQ
jgi:hypothetical protein